MRKAIFFDVDGTLLAVGKGVDHMTGRVVTALRNLQKAGHYIFLATGRPLAFLYPELLNFGFDGYVLSNGAVVTLNNTIIFEQEIDKAIVKKICDYAESENIEYVLEGYPQVYYRNNSPACDKFFNALDIDNSKFVREFDIGEISVYKIECVTTRNDLENVDRVYKNILATPGFYGWSDPFHYKSLEIYKQEISKASGILHALEYLNIDVADSYAFGDGLNDIEMMQTVGNSFAMGTGSDELKRLAKFVVPSVYEDGVAVGVEKYIIGERV